MNNTATNIVALEKPPRKLALAAPIEREKRLSDAAKYAIEHALKKPPNLAHVSLSTPAAPGQRRPAIKSKNQASDQ